MAARAREEANMDDLMLYHSPSSPNSRRVRIFLAEKQLRLPKVVVDLGKREQFGNAFAAINPRLQVPVLRVGDESITEVPVIQRYIEDVQPTPPLLGTTPLERARIGLWDRRIELDFFAPVMEGVRNAAAGLVGRALSGPHDYDQIPALVERNRKRVENAYHDLDARLQQSMFVAGDEFSVADITALVSVDFATGGLKMPIPEDLANVRRWYACVSARPSVLG
jgi:glutathione S-transferase